VWGWNAGFAVFLALPPAGVLALAAIEHEAATWDSIRAYLLVKSTPAALKRRLLRRRDGLAALLEQTHAWLVRSSRV
jgi:hypothetical protein